MRPLPSAVLDVVAVSAFVVAGRRTHADALDAGGVAATAWPFLAALALGWVITFAWRAPAAVVRTGVPVWAVTVIAGLALRRVTGEGTAAPFVLVAALVLGVLLVGWRAVVLLLRRG